MRFIIDRTYRKDYHTSPCDGAFTPQSEMGKHFPTWYIDVGTVEELVELSRKVGHELVVGVNEKDGKSAYIEIYDGYRE